MAGVHNDMRPYLHAKRTSETYLSMEAAANEIFDSSSSGSGLTGLTRQPLLFISGIRDQTSASTLKTTIIHKRVHLAVDN